LKYHYRPKEEKKIKVYHGLKGKLQERMAILKAQNKNLTWTQRMQLAREKAAKLAEVSREKYEKYQPVAAKKFAKIQKSARKISRGGFSDSAFGEMGGSMGGFDMDMDFNFPGVGIGGPSGSRKKKKQLSMDIDTGGMM